MKTKLSSFDQIFTVMHTVPLFCHIVNLSVQYTHTTTFNNFEQRRFLFIRRFNWKWNTSLIYLLVILEYVLISLMPHSELCRRDQIPPNPPVHSELSKSESSVSVPKPVTPFQSWLQWRTLYGFDTLYHAIDFWGQLKIWRKMDCFVGPVGCRPLGSNKVFYKWGGRSGDSFWNFPPKVSACACERTCVCLCVS